MQHALACFSSWRLNVVCSRRRTIRKCLCSACMQNCLHPMHCIWKIHPISWVSPSCTRLHHHEYHFDPMAKLLEDTCPEDICHPSHTSQCLVAVQSYPRPGCRGIYKRFKLQQLTAIMGPIRDISLHLPCRLVATEIAKFASVGITARMPYVDATSIT